MNPLPFIHSNISGDGFQTSLLSSMNRCAKIVPAVLRVVEIVAVLLLQVTRAELAVSPGAGPAGTIIHVTGHVPGGSAGVRLLWQQGGQAQGYLEAPVNGEGAFDLSIVTPGTATPGSATLYSLPTESLDGPIEGAPFTVLATPSETVSGTVNVPNPGANPPFQPPPTGTKVCLKDVYGQIVACTTTDPNGGWTLTVPPGTYVVETDTTGVQDPPVTVPPGGSTSVAVTPLDGTTLQVCEPKFFLHGFEVNSDSSGALLGKPTVALGRKDSTPFARFVSFGNAAGAPDVSVTFTVSLEATCNMKVGNVVFTLRDVDGNAVYEQITTSDKSPKDFDTRTATMPVSHLPEGKLSMTVSVFPGNPQNPMTASWSYPIEVVDLSPRWFSGNAKKDGGQPFIQVTALPEEHAIQYSLHAVVPQQAIQLTGGDIALGPLSLENHAILGIKLDEFYTSEKHFGGQALGQADVALLKLSAFGQTVKSIVDVHNNYAFSGPKAVGGIGFFATEYLLPETSLGKDSEEVPIFGAGKQKCIKFCLFGCKKCVGFKVGLFAKIEGGADLGMKVTPTLGAQALVAPCVKASLPLIFQLDVVVCSAGAKAEAAASARLPLRFNFADGAGFHFDSPNLRLQSTLKYYARCFGITFFRGSKILANYQWGPGPIGDSCGDPFILASEPKKKKAGELTPDEEAGPVTSAEIPTLLQPAVSVNGACENMTVWIGGPQEGVDADGRLRFSYTDQDGSSVPANIDPAGAMAESPSVAWLNNTHALAVWSQSTKPLADLAFEVEPAIPSTLELAWATWDTTTLSWSPPQYITSDDRWDLRPVLAANPSTGDAVVLWLRQHEVNPATPEPLEPRGLYYARYHAGGWSAPAPVIDTTSAFYYQPTVRYDRFGAAHAVLVGDADGNPETANDRVLKLLLLGPGGWSLEEDIPAPAGAFNPSLDFDTANNPVVAYLVPPTDPSSNLPTGGDGNGSTLGLAQKFQGVWRRIDSLVAGERPTLRIDPSNRAFVLIRRFGHGEDGGAHDSGDRALSQADLGAPNLILSTGYATGDGQLHWEPAFDMDPATGCAVFGESAGDPSGTAGVTVQHGEVKRGPDLSVVPGSFVATDPHPAVNQVISVSFRLTNIGLDAAVGGFKIKFYDGAIEPKKQPFAVDDFVRDFPPGFEVTIAHDYTNMVLGAHFITVIVDAENKIAELEKSNNLGLLHLGEVPSVCQLSGRPTDDGRATLIEWLPPAFTTDTAPVYYLQRRTLPAGPWEILGFGTLPSFIDPLAKPGVAYQYRVIVKDGAGVFSPPCGTVFTQIDGRPVVDRPTLSVRFEGGRAAILSWPTRVTGFTVQTTTNLSSRPIVWTETNLAPVIVGDHFEVTAPATDSKRFYRLTAH